MFLIYCLFVEFQASYSNVREIATVDPGVFVLTPKCLQLRSRYGVMQYSIK